MARPKSIEVLTSLLMGNVPVPPDRVEKQRKFEAGQ